MSADYLALIDRFAAIGATPGGGVRRLTGSAEDGAARRLFAAEAEARGAALHVDPVGNMFATFRIAGDSPTTVLTGSHLDSQPTGGRFDGTLGVVASLVAADEVARRIRAGEARAVHQLTVVNWTNEEGARFQPSLTGSTVYAGTYPLEKALQLRDRLGIALGDELAAIGFAGQEPLPLRCVRYLELHVEQGGRLEAEGVDIGVVSRSWATRKLALSFVGAPSHTGPTPMARRRDAMRAAAYAITTFHARLEEEAADALLHWAAAKIVAEPDSPNVVASRVTVWFEIRNMELEVADSVAERFLAAIRPEIERQGIGIEVYASEGRPGTPLDPDGRGIVLDAARAAGKSVIEMETITGHDALALQAAVPSSLFFVPSVDGLSHNEAELTLPEDLENGRQVMVRALLRMVGSA